MKLIVHRQNDNKLTRYKKKRNLHLKHKSKAKSKYLAQSFKLFIKMINSYYRGPFEEDPL